MNVELIAVKGYVDDSAQHFGDSHQAFFDQVRFAK